MHTAKPFTPDSLAERWGCSSNHVRNLIHAGELQAFRLGRRLFRIPVEAVEEYEKRQTITSPDPAPVMPSASTPVSAIVITHSRERKRIARNEAQDV